MVRGSCQEEEEGNAFYACGGDQTSKYYFLQSSRPSFRVDTEVM